MKYLILYAFKENEDKVYISVPMGTCVMSMQKPISDTEDTKLIEEQIKKDNGYCEVHILAFSRFETTQ